MNANPSLGDRDWRLGTREFNLANGHFKASAFGFRLSSFLRQLTFDIPIVSLRLRVSVVNSLPWTLREA